MSDSPPNTLIVNVYPSPNLKVEKCKTNINYVIQKSKENIDESKSVEK